MSNNMKELLQEVAEKIVGKYQTPSEGTYNDAHDILRMVIDWAKEQPEPYFRSAAKRMQDTMKAKWICPHGLSDCKSNCGNYGCGN